ncbi:hypothetical protein Cfor_00812 [Coptotermes formosanus]|uniref:TATA-box-binding protein n=1 Tax=Coptotermes formosanus TaxID=36987 RepID=A0A6L2PXG3_COPFO|nr:hypothetical protein Cfor_00812 [Coptotermes formosanus]
MVTKRKLCVAMQNDDLTSCVCSGEVTFMMAESDKKSIESSKAQCAEHLTSPQHTVTSMPPPSSSAVPRPASTHVAPHSLITPLTPVTGDPGLVPTLQNVVSTVNLACPLDLMKINFRTRNSEYNPSRFSGIVMRIREPHTTALLFRSGKMVITGARNEADSRLAARKYARIIQKLGFPVKFLEFKVQNIVGTCDLRFPIRVENLNQMHGQFSSRWDLQVPLSFKAVKRKGLVLLGFLIKIDQASEAKKFLKLSQKIEEQDEDLDRWPEDLRELEAKRWCEKGNNREGWASVAKGAKVLESDMLIVRICNAGSEFAPYNSGMAFCNRSQINTKLLFI